MTLAQVFWSVVFGLMVYNLIMLSFNFVEHRHTQERMRKLDEEREKLIGNSK